MNSFPRTTLLALPLLAACAGSPPRAPERVVPRDTTADPGAWVDAILPRLTLEDRIAQLIIVPMDGAFMNAHSADAHEVDRLVADLHVGGLLVDGGTPLELATRLNALQRRAPLPLLVMARPEWTEQRTVLPPAMGLAATTFPLSSELAGRVAGSEARAAGIHWLLGPSARLARRLADSAVDARAFSSDPSAVARHTDAWVRGVRSSGVMATLLDFPGSGGAVRAEHSLPVIEAEREEIERDALFPYFAVARLGVESILVDHVAVPAFTGDRTTPASTAPSVMTDLLRKQLQFDGIVLTAPLRDSVLREAPAYAPAALPTAAILAGADLVIAPHDPAQAHRELVNAVRSGRIPYSRIETSVRRVLMAKARLGLQRDALTSLDSLANIVAAPQHDAIAARLADESITITRDPAALLPLDPRSVHRIAVIAITPPRALDAGAALAAELRATYGSGVTFDRIDATTAESLIDGAVTRAGLAHAVILATFAPLDAGAERAAVYRTTRRVLQRLTGVNYRTVVATFGNLPGASELNHTGAHLMAWQPAGKWAQVAAARAIAGRIIVGGRLPFVTNAAPDDGVRRDALTFALTRAEPAEVGMDAEALRRVDEMILRGIRGGVSPGAAIAIGRHGRIVKLRGYGQLDLRRGFESVTDSSLYDLASITKVVGTTSALAILVDRGLLDLDLPVQHYLPEWRGSDAKEAVTLRNLVLHNSGLAAYAPLYQTLRGRQEYRRKIAAMELTYAPGTRTVYSDFGIVLLGMIIEQVAGQPLDAFLERELFGPLGMRDTGFNPLRWPYPPFLLEEADLTPSWVLNRIAPTELDTLFRFTQVHGVVHDENAFAMGGVAGHAGLFSSARDLAVFAQLMLNRGWYGGRRFMDPATVAAFTRRHSDASSRAIGWDTPSDNSSAGEYFSASSFGHTGFTGTSLWIDPERDLFLVFLTNRVNFGRDNQRHVALRSAVADAVIQAIVDEPVARRTTSPPSGH